MYKFLSNHFGFLYSTLVSIAPFVNLGNPTEHTIIDLAKKIRSKIDPNINIIFKPLPEDDPLQRKPIIEKAKNLLGWNLTINLERGLENTIHYFKENI